MQDSEFIWFNGKIIPWGEATIHVMAHALHYGSSVFEGLRAYETPKGPAIFRLAEHTKRLFDSAKIHRIEIPFEQEDINKACKEVIKANKLKAAYLRPIAFRGAGKLGVRARGCPIEVAIAAFPWGAYLGEDALEAGVDICVSSWRRPQANSVPSLAKAGANYITSQLIVTEAQERGFAEGIALDHQGCVAEGSGENIFLIRQGVIYTPPVWTSILPGLTRDSIIKLARELGIKVVEEPISRDALYIADELFFTGTAAEVTPIRSVDGLKIGEGRRGPVTQRIQEAFFGLFTNSNDRFGWLDYIDG